MPFFSTDDRDPWQTTVGLPWSKYVLIASIAFANPTITPSSDEIMPMKERRVTYFVLHDVWVRYRRPLHEMMSSAHGLLYGVILPPYEIVASVLLSGKDDWGNNFVKWKPFYISKTDYDYAAKLLRHKYSFPTGRPVPGIDTLEKWRAYIHHLNYSGFPMEDHIRLTRTDDAYADTIHELECQAERTGTDFSPQIREYLSKQKLLWAEWEELDKLYPLLPRAERDAIEREHLIAIDIKRSV